MQEVGGALRMGRSREDEPLVVAQDLQPALDVGGMVVPWGQFQAKVSAEEGGPKFGHQLLTGITLVTPTRAAEVPVNPGRMPGPMGIMPTSA